MTTESKKRGMPDGKVTKNVQTARDLKDTADRLAAYSPDAVNVLKAISERDEALCLKYNVDASKITPKDQLNASNQLLRLVASAQKNANDFALQRLRLLTERSNARTKEKLAKVAVTSAKAKPAFQTVAKLKTA